MKTWSQDEQIQYELARDVISSLASVLSRVGSRTNDLKVKMRLKTRAVELRKEVLLFDGFDTDIVKSVITTYSPLTREYCDSNLSKEDIATIGLDEKYLNTKVNYDA